MRCAGPFALALALAAGCSGSPAQPVSCDPLATTTLPITAGTFVAAGKDSAGTVYLIDEAPAGHQRLFVSNGQVLQRQPAGGTGEIGDSRASYLIVTSTSGGSELQVAVERGPAGPTKMGVHRGPLSGKTFMIGMEGEQLTLLASADVKTFTLANLPGEVNIEHLGTLPDGRLLLVTSPAVDFNYQAFRLFFGPRDHLVERTGSLQVTRGSYTRLTFDVDGHKAEAVFGSELAPSVMSQITIDGTTQPLAVESPVRRPEGAAFFCQAH
jgi:hypothetical protein